MSEKKSINMQVVEPLIEKLQNGKANEDTGQPQSSDNNFDTTCGIFNFRPRWLQRFATIKVMFTLLALTVLSFSLAMSVTIVGITSLQKRYGLSSSFIGLYHTMKDIAEIISVIVVTYFGGRPNCHKPRWIAGGLALCSLAFLLKASTQFVSDPFDYESLQFGANVSAEMEVCEPERDLDEVRQFQYGDSDACNDNFLSSIIPKGSEGVLLLILGNMLLGLGNTPLFTLAIAYIDDNVPKEKSPMYTGTFFSIFGIGPIVGMPMASYFINLYVDFYRVDPADVDLHPSDPRWVGAWWLGYLLLSVPIMILAFLVSFVPKRMPVKTGSPSPEEKVLKEKPGQSVVQVPVKTGSPSSKEKILQEKPRQSAVQDNKTAKRKFKEFPKALGRICSNVTLMAVIFARAAMMANQGAITFIVKFTEEQFRVTTTISGIVIASMIFSACLGFFIGGIILRRWKPSLIKMAAFMVVVDIFSLFAPMVQMWLGCDTAVFAGITEPYVGSTLDVPAYDIEGLNSTCNAMCACSGHYKPMCGSDNVTYYSPCHAGCKIAKDAQNFTSCGCVLNHEEFNDISYTVEGEAHAGICGQSCFYELIWYTAVNFVFTALAAMSMTAELTLSLRCVAPSDKPFALGVRSFVSQLIGTLPSPLYTGLLIDSACILWGTTKCDERGACLLYDLPDYRFKFMGLLITFRSLTILLYVVALLSLLRNPDPGKTAGLNQAGKDKAAIGGLDEKSPQVVQMVTSI